MVIAQRLRITMFILISFMILLMLACATLTLGAENVNSSGESNDLNTENGGDVENMPDGNNDKNKDVSESVTDPFALEDTELFPFENADNYCGYVSSKGLVVIDFDFKNCRKFSSGLGLVSLEDGSKAFIDKAGELVIPLNYRQVRLFSEGMAAVQSNETGLWGFIDTTGELVAPTEYSEVFDCVDNICLFFTPDYESGFMNTDGEVVFYGPVGGIEQFISDGMLVLQDTAWRGGSRTSVVINAQGQIIVEWSEDGAGLYDHVIGRMFGYSEGLAAATRYEESKYGYLDKQGEFAIEPKWDQGHPFSEGLAGVRSGSHWGFIDNTGVVIVTPMYDAVGNFSEGLAWVRDENGKYSYINTNGEIVFALPDDLEAATAGDFSDGVAIITTSEWREAILYETGEIKLLDESIMSCESSLHGVSLCMSIESGGEFIMINQLGEQIYP